MYSYFRDRILAEIQITVVEMLRQILTFLDLQLAKMLKGHVKSKAANVLTEAAVAGFLGENVLLSC